MLSGLLLLRASLIPDRIPFVESAVEEAEEPGALNGFGPVPAYLAKPYSSEPVTPPLRGEPSRWSTGDDADPVSSGLLDEPS